MPFKIVQTIENSQICLSIVPSDWEENGILYWPNKSKIVTYKLQRQEHSLPDKNKWGKMTCIKKRELSAFEEAEMEVMNMEDLSDTENENSNSRRKQKKTTPKPLLDLNYLVEDNVIEIENASCRSGPKVIEDEQVFQPQKLVPSGSSLENRANTQYYILVDSCVNQQENLELKKIIENQEFIIEQVIKLKISVEGLVNVISEKFETQQTISKINENFEFSPIDSEEKMKCFEEQLENESFYAEFIERMSLVCGKTGKENGMDVCYKLVDHVLERNFLKKCSWTGNSKMEGEAKIPLKYFQNFKKCFFNTVLLADKDFTEQKCDIFLKRILKNSAQRCNAKRIMSTHKNRPKGLEYSKKETENPFTDIPVTEERCDEDDLLTDNECTD